MDNTREQRGGFLSPVQISLNGGLELQKMGNKCPIWKRISKRKKIIFTGQTMQW
jgi:hypothetical protein